MRWDNAMENRRRQCRNQAGFTIVELIVVMALMLILLTSGIRGLTGFARYAEFKKQNEYAGAIYLAAQTELTKRSQNGQLPALIELFADDRPMDVERLTRTDGSFTEAGQVWPYREGRIYAMEASGQNRDYARYLEGELKPEDPEDKKVQVLYELIDSYILDKTILMEGTIRIEMAPSEGLVYAVLYSSHWPEGFEDGADSTSEAKAGFGGECGDITDRSTEHRKKAMIGYYGVDTLSSSVSGRTEKPVIRSLKLQNQEILCVSWQIDAGDKDAWKELTYDITLYGGIVWKDAEDDNQWETAEDEAKQNGNADRAQRKREAGQTEQRDGRAAAGGEDGGESGTEHTELQEMELEEVCTIVLNPGASVRIRHPAGQSGIPRKLTTLDSGGGLQTIQALVVQNEQEEWRCFSIILDELQYRITLILNDPRSGSAEADGEEASGSDADHSWFSYCDYGWMDPLDEEQAERISCTVVGYGDGYVSTSMKESGQVTCDFSDREEENEEGDEEAF